MKEFWSFAEFKVIVDKNTMYKYWQENVDCLLKQWLIKVEGSLLQDNAKVTTSGSEDDDNVDEKSAAIVA